MTCCVMLCYVMLCYVMSCYVLLCDVMRYSIPFILLPPTFAYIHTQTLTQSLTRRSSYYHLNSIIHYYLH